MKLFFIVGFIASILLPKCTVAQSPFERERIALGIAPLIWNGTQACKLSKEENIMSGYGIEMSSGVILQNHWAVMFNNILCRDGLNQIPYLPDNSIYDKEPITRYVMSMDIQRFHHQIPLMLSAGIGLWLYDNNNRYKPKPNEPYANFKEHQISAKGLNSSLKAAYILHQGDWFSQQVFLSFHYTYVTQWQIRDVLAISNFSDNKHIHQFNAGVNIEFHKLKFPERVPLLNR